MRKTLFLLFITAFAYQLKAQKPFPQVYKSAWPINVDYRYSNDDKTLALGGDMRAISMMDATNGQILWTMTFKESLGVKKAIDWGWENELGYVWVKIKTDDKDVELTTNFDEKTGAKIEDISSLKAKKTKYARRSNWKSFQSYAGSFDDDAANVHISLEYKRKLVGAAAGKGTTTDITVQSTGSHTWSTTFQGKLIRSLCDNAVGSSSSQDFGGDYINMVVSNGRVFVIYEGISVFDLNTGTKLWETTFDNADYNFGLLKSSQVLGKAAMPMVAEDGVYVADLSKGNHKIKKFGLDKGNLIWESETLGKDDIVPELRMVNGTLIVRLGGKTEVQTYIPGQNGRPDVCKKEYKMLGPFGIKAFDAKTGSLLWQTKGRKDLADKFSGSISNLLVDGNNVWFVSSKNAFCMDAKTGSVVSKTDLSKAGIGLPDDIWVRKGSLIIEAAAGVASVEMSSGKLNFGAKTKKNFGSFGSEDAFYVWVGKSAFDYQNFVRIDLDNGQILGIQKETKYPQFAPDYESFLKYDGSKIYRFKTRP